MGTWVGLIVWPGPWRLRIRMGSPANLGFDDRVGWLAERGVEFVAMAFVAFQKCLSQATTANQADLQRAHTHKPTTPPGVGQMNRRHYRLTPAPV